MKEKEFLPALSTRLGIEELNEMQKTMLREGVGKKEVVLLSPTGSGKTLAFVMPMLKSLKAPSGQLQAVVIAPSRELVMQISGIIRELAHGYKTLAIYGGHSAEDEQNSLLVTPDIIVGTPGRMLDHMQRGNLEVLPTRILILDEFDKSLELGFEEEMRKILGRMKNLSRIIVTSATDMEEMPDYLPMKEAARFNFLSENSELRKRMSIKSVASDNKDKLEGLLTLLRDRYRAMGKDSRAIVFVNHRDSAERVAMYLAENDVACVLYHGMLDQRDREKAVAMFNNGTAPVMVATDLASRGLDIEGVSTIIHYHQPFTAQAFVHRNGRTARIKEEGEIFMLLDPDEEVKEFVNIDDSYAPEPQSYIDIEGAMSTIYIGEGRKEKLSRGDVLGFLTKECGISPEDVGKIDVYDHYILVAVKKGSLQGKAAELRSKKIKGKRRKIEIEGIG